MTTILDTKIGKVKIVPNVSDLVTTNAPDTEVGEVENKVPDHAKYITTREFNKFAGTKIDKRPEQINFVTNKDLNTVLKCTNKMKQNEMFDLR